MLTLLADVPDIQELVFGAETLSVKKEHGPPPREHKSQEAQLAALRISSSSSSSSSSSPPPRGHDGSKPWAPHNPVDSPERSVRLSAVNSGGKAPEKLNPRYARLGGRSVDDGGATIGITTSGKEEDTDEQQVHGREEDQGGQHDVAGPGSQGCIGRFCDECGARAKRQGANYCFMCGQKLGPT